MSLIKIKRVPDWHPWAFSLAALAIQPRQRHQVVLCKMHKDARLAPDCFSNLSVSATQNHEKSSYIIMVFDS